MTAGYSGTPLIKKLGIKAGTAVCFLHAPDHLSSLLGDLPEGADIKSVPPYHFMHAFYDVRAEMSAELPLLMQQIVPDGMIWVSWPKKASGVKTDITEDTVREVALPLGLVDVKVCAVDEVWSGLKLMIRKELRDNL